MPRKPAAAGPKKPTPKTKPTKPKAGKAKAKPPAAAEPPAERKPTVIETPADPHRLARQFVYSFTDGRSERLRFWNGDYLLWDGSAYRPVPPGDLQCRLTKTVREEFVRLNVEAVAAWQAGDEEGKAPTVKLTTGKIVADAMQAVRGIALLEAYASPPCWIDGGTGPDPAAAVPMANGVLDVAAAAAGRPDCLTPPTPQFFTLTSVPFPFHPAPPPPAEWLTFLASVWPDDPQCVECLRQWAGYLLTGDTRHHKMLFLIGPPRAGKGVILQVLRGLVGEANTAGVTLASLADPFGLQHLLGKSLALVSDVRLGGRADIYAITERLLAISGGDLVPVARKFKSTLSMKLGVRLVLASNELPRLTDASQALADRFLVLPFRTSFLGKEDKTLTVRLLAELPSIFAWAVGGWADLRERGRFTQPESGGTLLTELRDLCSPVGLFVREHCVVDPAGMIAIQELYREWATWCTENGRREVGMQQTFGRDLRAAVPSLGDTRTREGGDRVRHYRGIRLRTVGDDDDPGPRGPRTFLFNLPGRSGTKDEVEERGLISRRPDHADRPDRANGLWPADDRESQRLPD